MRSIRPIVTLVAATLATAPLAGSLGGRATWAQTNPSADQIINQLKPKMLGGPTRGIRPVSPGGAAETPSSAADTHTATATPGPRPRGRPSPGVQQAAVTPSADAPAVSLTVEFATGSAALTPQAMTTLDELGKALSSEALASYRFRIEGHTDTVGTPDYNKALSGRRADAVAAYIEHKYGIAPARLTPVGLGSSQLAVPTGAQVPEMRNRRVQVINLGA